MKKYSNYIYNTLLTIGIVIGVGIFFKNKSIIAAAHGDTKIIISGWVIGALISLASAVAFSLLSFKIKHSDNSSAEFARAAFGEKTGFATKWAFSLIYFPIYIFVIAIFSSMQLLKLFNYAATSALFPIILFTITIAIILLFIFFVYYEEKVMKVFNLSATAVKLIPFVILIIVAISAIFSKNSDAFWNGHPQINPRDLNPSSFNQTSSMSSIAIIFWIIPAIKFAYDGFLSVTSNKRSSSVKSLSWGITIGMSIVSVIFILTTVAILKEGVSSVPEAIISFLGGDINNLRGFYLVLDKILIIVIALSGFGSMAGFMILWKKMCIQICDDEKINHKHSIKIILLGLFISTFPWVILSFILFTTNLGMLSKQGTDVVDEISNIVLLISFALNAAILIRFLFLVFKNRVQLSWVFVITSIISIIGISAVAAWKIIDHLFIQIIYHGDELGLFGWPKWCYTIVFAAVLAQFLVAPSIGRLFSKWFSEKHN